MNSSRIANKAAVALIPIFAEVIASDREAGTKKRTLVANKAAVALIPIFAEVIASDREAGTKKRTLVTVSSDKTE